MQDRRWRSEAALPFQRELCALICLRGRLGNPAGGLLLVAGNIPTCEIQPAQLVRRREISAPALLQRLALFSLFRSRGIAIIGNRFRSPVFPGHLPHGTLRELNRLGALFDFIPHTRVLEGHHTQSEILCLAADHIPHSLELLLLIQRPPLPGLVHAAVISIILRPACHPSSGETQVCGHWPEILLHRGVPLPLKSATGPP